MEFRNNISLYKGKGYYENYKRVDENDEKGTITKYNLTFLLSMVRQLR
jgi:hypothetical protein